MSKEYKKFKNECSIEINKQGKSKDLQLQTNKWLEMANEHKYSYHFEFLGRPIIQYPQDMIAVQELIWEVKPDLIIETGIAHGGSLIMSASMLAMLDICEAIDLNQIVNPRESKRRVIGIDIDIRKHNFEAIRSHPMSSRIEMIQGSSIDQSTVKKVYEIAKNYQNVMVFLDSNHSHQHVLAELEFYAPLTSKGSYCVVFDSIVEDLPDDMFSNRPWGNGDNPKTAIWEYLKKNDMFEIDQNIQNKILITVAPDGYLRRVK